MTHCSKNGDLMLGKVLEHMCNKNDHDTVLLVLQLLDKSCKVGYLTVPQLHMCSIYCSNKFAENGNYKFFQEYIKSMPDISDSTLTSTLCKSYYFAYKQTSYILDTLQTECMLIDINDLQEWFKEYIIKNLINNHSQLTPLIEKAHQYRDTITSDGFKALSTLNSSQCIYGGGGPSE